MKKKQRSKIQPKTEKKKTEKEFPKEFPFWARFKKNKNRTTLIIDEELVLNKKSQKQEDVFVHREATHSDKKGFKQIFPNPDREDEKPMFLKRPTKKPKRMFEPHNKNLDMPEELREKYSKNNKK